MNSILGEEESYFDDEDLENERIERTQAMLAKLASLPSHITWFDEELYEPIVSTYVLCQIHLRELDKQIMNDPITYGSLEKVRNNTANRLSKLRNDLGLTAARIKQLTPEKKKGASYHEALAVMDEDFEA